MCYLVFASFNLDYVIKGYLLPLSLLYLQCGLIARSDLKGICKRSPILYVRRH